MAKLFLYIKEKQKQGQTYFTLEQLMSDEGISKITALNDIYRSKKQGNIISPAQGLYIIVPPEHQPYGCIPTEELTIILMKYLKADYYISLLSAAAFYGASHQKPNSFQIVTNKRIKHKLKFGQIKLDIIYKKELSNLPTKNFTMKSGYLKVATPELVILDLLNYVQKSAGLNHIATILSELIESVNIEQFINLAKEIAPITHLQRLGYILEKIDVMDEDKKNAFLKALESFLSGKPTVYSTLAPEISRAGYQKCKKWKIIENTTIESDL